MRASLTKRSSGSKKSGGKGKEQERESDKPSRRNSGNGSKEFLSRTRSDDSNRSMFSLSSHGSNGSFHSSSSSLHARLNGSASSLGEGKISSLAHPPVTRETRGLNKQQFISQEGTHPFASAEQQEEHYKSLMDQHQRRSLTQRQPSDEKIAKPKTVSKKSRSSSTPIIVPDKKKTPKARRSSDVSSLKQMHSSDKKNRSSSPHRRKSMTNSGDAEVSKRSSTHRKSRRKSDQQNSAPPTRQVPERSGSIRDPSPAPEVRRDSVKNEFLPSEAKEPPIRQAPARTTSLRDPSPPPTTKRSVSNEYLESLHLRENLKREESQRIQRQKIAADFVPQNDKGGIKNDDGSHLTKAQLIRERFELGKHFPRPAGPPLRPPVNVKAKPMPHVDASYQAPVFPKSKPEAQDIQQALSSILPTNNMSKGSVNQLVLAFEKKEYEDGEELPLTTWTRQPPTSRQRSSRNMDSVGGAKKEKEKAKDKNKKLRDKSSKVENQADMEDDDDDDDEEEQYFYVVEDGSVGIEVDGVEVGVAKKGDTIGDTNLHFSKAQSKTTFKAKRRASVFRVDQSTYRSILHSNRYKIDRDKKELLDSYSLLQHMSDENKTRLANALEAYEFKEGETLFDKDEDDGETFYIVSSGSLRCNVEFVNAKKSRTFKRTVERGQVIGEEAFLPKYAERPKMDKATVVAQGDGLLYKVNRAKFEAVIGKSQNVLLTPEMAAHLKEMPELRYNHKRDLSKKELAKLITVIQEKSYKANDVIVQEEGTPVVAATYFIRAGRAKETKGRFHYLKMEGNFFGEKTFAEALNSSDDKMMVESECVVHAKDDCVIGVLNIEDYREIFKDELMKLGKLSEGWTKRQETPKETNQSQQEEAPPQTTATETAAEKATDDETATETATETEDIPLQNTKAEKEENVPTSTVESAPQSDDVPPTKQHKIKLKHLIKKVMLGEGQFGQVWLVTNKKDKEERAYALKIQSKWELIEQGEADVCIREKNIMNQLSHPFIIKLFATFQDNAFVYLLLDMVSGGELWNLIFDPVGNEDTAELSTDGLPESQAKFYALVVADILKYMHGKGFVYRDLKPENILISSTGYPTLIDFGFAKKITDHTFTLCGTPGYSSPEMVLQQGHSFGVDHWALGILVYEMICKDSFFFDEDLHVMQVYKSICEDKFVPPKDRCSKRACKFMDALLNKDPVMRLGSLKGGEDDVVDHKWFDDLDYDALRAQKLDAPWIPKVSDACDASHFDDYSELQDKSTEEYPDLDEVDEDKFDLF